MLSAFAAGNPAVAAAGMDAARCRPGRPSPGIIHWRSPEARNCAEDRLSHSSKRVGPMRGLSPGTRGSVVQFRAEVPSVDVRDHSARVVLRVQEPLDEFVEAEPLRTGQLDRAVHRRPDREVGQRGGDVVGHDGLHQRGRQADCSPVGGRLGDAGEEVEELRRAEGRAEDGVRNPGRP
jgi:hypothetical protein